MCIFQIHDYYEPYFLGCNVSIWIFYVVVCIFKELDGKCSGAMEQNLYKLVSRLDSD